jgi:hypothetical protein
MNALREQFNKPLTAAIAGFILGLIIGLPILGWQLWPVEWKDAGPQHLRSEYKEIYLRMAMDSYSKNSDLVQAQQRVKEVGAEASQILAEIARQPGRQDPAVVKVFQTIAQAGPVAQVTPGAPTPTLIAGVATPKPTAAPKGGGGPWTTLLYFCGAILLVLIAAVAVYFLLRGRLKLPLLRKKEAARPQPQEFQYEMGEEPPIAQFMTTYSMGNDLYDDSFSIESQSGEFLGECGVGISETIGVGEPKRVTAFEVWLFDKNDIQTVTQVLMSQHAFADDATRQRLATKGEPVFAEPGRELVLETATLRLIARVVDMTYGSGPLPAESFFDRMTLQLSVWPKS